METRQAQSAYPVQKTEEEWQRILTPEQYAVIRQKATERPFTGKYNHFDEPGVFTCAACANPLFSSDAKFDSGSGWPSFFQPLTQGNIEEETDRQFGMRRTEALCQQCGAHLGHVFEDGPAPTGLRYCINSASLNFLNSQADS